jgi:hypothetical protein
MKCIDAYVSIYRHGFVSVVVWSDQVGATSLSVGKCDQQRCGWRRIELSAWRGARGGMA